ncbi:threonine synthase [Elysia marginata]|uniref:Threonine synthase-like 2 n=1 Tax=Elysia marginata TaxID=1093978 RepID=A0AAV4JV10_9GAST|nr:threonine synthase [Elysia marginata]
MAFKDVGARFMSRSLTYLDDSSKDITVLVATSGDTGGAVASGFWKVPGVKVVILFPSGKVSEIQEKQLTTFDENVKAIEVEGTFDDCQSMVRKAFLDSDFSSLNLTSANSINVARWLPQMFYYFFAYKQLKNKDKDFVFSVPSGNFGNICAGIVSKRLGLPVQKFVASTNLNDTVPNYLDTGIYTPKPSKATISNAMDVGNPSNFPRIQRLFQDSLALLKKEFVSYSFDDNQTREALKTLFHKYDYIADPHGAVAYLGAERFREKSPDTDVIFLETAHPSKFLNVVEDTLNIKIKIPSQILSVLNRASSKQKISTYDDFKSSLLL